MQVAITTFAILKAPYGNPQVQEFDDRTPDVFAEAESSDGFIERALEVEGSENVSNFERNWGKWGAFNIPSFYPYGRTNETDRRASTISIWNDLDSVLSFVYRGLHLDALKNKHNWFERTEWPTYGAWWIEKDHQVTWTDASNRLEHLHKNGPTNHCFTLRTCFDQQGCLIDKRSPKQPKFSKLIEQVN